MRHLQWGTLALGLTSLVAVAGLVGCGSKEESSTGNNAETAPSTKTKKKTGGELKGLASGSGSLKGRVVFEGAKPDLVALNKDLRAQIEKKPDDKNHCLTGASEIETEQQTWRIGENNGLANVFVWLKPAEGTFFELNEETPGVKAHKGKDVVIDQPHCAFMPHAVALFPSYKDAKKKTVPTGEKLVVKNSAPMAHNTKYGGEGQSGGNNTIPPGKSMEITDLKPSSDKVGIECTIHLWMNGVARVFDNPYFAITDKDGNYEIKNVPAGKVQVIAWHEAAKYLTSGGAKGETITLEDKENTKDFTAHK